MHRVSCGVEDNVEKLAVIAQRPESRHNERKDVHKQEELLQPPEQLQLSHPDAASNKQSPQTSA